MDIMEVRTKVEYSFPSTYAGEKMAKELEERLKPLETKIRINTQRIVISADWTTLLNDPENFELKLIKIGGMEE